MRQSAPKLIEGNAGVTVLTPVAPQNSVNVAVAGADGAIKTTQASMSGIQALAAAAAATQKITVSPQTAQLKLGNLIEWFLCINLTGCIGFYSFITKCNSTSNTR